MHPLWQTANAYFVSLRLEQEPRPDYVRYSFEFWEDSGQQVELKQVTSEQEQEQPKPAADAPYHTVVQGDTLWGISRRYGVSLEKLLELNPFIKNPNLIRMGEKVRLE